MPSKEKKKEEGGEGVPDKLDVSATVNPEKRGEAADTTRKNPSTEDDGSNEDEYNLPDDYQDLDELQVPSPVESTVPERQQGYLEDRQSGNKESESPLSSDLVQEEEEKRISTAHIRPSPVSRLATELYTIAYLIFFSILGTLARLGLQALTFYPGAPVQTSILWPNVAGSFIMGFLIEDRKFFSGEDWIQNHHHHSLSSSSFPSQHPLDEEQQRERHTTIKKTVPLYIGLSTGFCGSFTSFSSFLRDIFLALANRLPVPISHLSSSGAPIDSASTVSRNGGYSVMALLSVIIVTVALCLGALIVGAHLAIATERFTPSIKYLFARRFLDRGVVVLGFGCWLGAVLMAIWPPDRHKGYPEYWRGTALFAIVFAPLGCLARFYMSVALNSRIKSFPLGTFAINMIGTALEGIFWDLQHSQSTVGGGRVGCQVLQGMMDGFCGAATTVSTWVAELNGLRRRHAYFYGGMSVTVGVGILVCVMGSVLWGRGWARVSCAS
ncbi:MAG: hypothetical protein Q9220_000687 [cf. Caloplaca sp. 1 TL-2023]